MMDKIILFLSGTRGEILREAMESAGHEILHEVRPDTYDDINNDHACTKLAVFNPNLFIVAGFPYIFREPILRIPKYGCWNCHAGPVPDYRGGSPLNWQIINGETDLGVSLIKMDQGIDTGPVISREFFPLLENETIKEAHEKANSLFCKMVLNALSDFPPKAVPQNKGRYWRQRSDKDGELDLTWPAERIRNFVRALTRPYPGAWIKAVDGKTVRIWSVSVD